MNQTPETAVHIDRPSVTEWWAVLILLIAFFVFNLASYNYYPAVWCDEVLYSEPAINLLRHGSYTTDAYEFQPPHTFPIVNCPLYGMSLVPWLAATGTSLLAVRSFNYALMTLAAFLCWNISWRFGLVRSSVARLLMVVVLPLGYGTSYGYRSCRPDILGLVCLLFLLLSLRIARPRLKEFCLFGLAAATVWIGLQVALYAWFAAAVGWLLFRQTAQPAQPGAGSPHANPAGPLGLRELIVLSAGMVLGAGSLVLFISSKGMLAYFLPPILGIVKGTFYGGSHSHSIAATFGNLVHRILVIYCEDFSTLILTPVLLVLLLGGRRSLSFQTRKLVLYGFVLAFGAPALFEVVGHFAFYYSYLRFVPATLVLFAAYSELSLSRGAAAPRWFRPAVALALVAAVAVGLPLRLGLAMACSNLVPRAELQQVLSSHLQPHDTAFSEYIPFFEVKRIAPVTYHFYCSSVLYPTGIRGSDLSAEKKQAVSVLVIRPEQKDKLAAFFGGVWQPVTPPFGDTQDFSRVASLPIIGRKFASYSSQPQTERYQLQVFRREPD